MQSSKFLSFGQRARFGQGIAAAALSVLCLLTAPSALAQPASQGASYSPVPPVVSQQAQVVFFRKPANSAAAGVEPAHVYINGVFHTALKPDMFTRFCVPTGNYSIEAHIGDAPKFVAKARQATRASLEGGKTYFVAVSENRTGEPTPVRRAEAEGLLRGAVEQRHFVNRSAAIVPCQEAPQSTHSEPVSYTLNADVLFAFAGSDYASISSRGREELRKVAQQIRERSPNSVSRITVRGHADPIGSAESNVVLSEQRARTVARVLSEEGLAAERVRIEGVGSAEPVVSCSMRGSLEARVDCNAPNRRVEVVVAGGSAT